MRRGRRFLPLAGVLAVAGVTAATALAASVSWGSAIEVPGSGALNAGGSAQVLAISCTGTGSCSAGGFYKDGPDGTGHHAFVATETNGSWGNAIEVPGTGALNVDRDAQVTLLSCTSPGNCSAGGYYTDGGGNTHGFVANEKNGAWGNAVEVPGLAALDSNGFSSVSALGCHGTGNCTIGGSYYDNGGHLFVAVEKAGVWGNAITLPGAAALHFGANVTLDSISCGSASTCTAGGSYLTGIHYQAFIISEKKGVWGKAKEVPGTAALNAGGRADVISISCTSATACTAGGTYLDSSNNTQAFTVSTSKMGAWGAAKRLPGTGTYATLTSLSCASPGNCSAGGNFSAPDGTQAFVVSSKAGKWGSALEVPGIAALDNSTDSEVFNVSCASAGNCAATGYYDAAPREFIVSEKNGVWANAVPIPGLDNLGPGTGGAAPVSCAKAGPCGVGGQYYNGVAAEAFVTSP